MATNNSDNELAEELANIARSVLLNYQLKGKDIKYKPDASPVTDADINCETQMRTLISTLAPNDAIWGEELGKVTGERVWVLDPLDGTKAYCTGSPLYASLIALVVNDIAEIGVVEFPALQTRYFATKDKCTVTDPKGTRELKVNNNETNLARSRLSVTYPYADDKNITNLLSQVGIVRYGGDAYNFVLVTEGKLEIALDASLQPHDFCALLPMLAASGVSFSDYQGNKLKINEENNLLVTANEEIHEKVLKIINE